MKDSTIIIKNYPNQLEKENKNIRIKVNKYVFLLQGEILNRKFTEQDMIAMAEKGLRNKDFARDHKYDHDLNTTPSILLV